MSYQELALDRIRITDANPRKTFYNESLEELAASIRERGVLEPIVVRPLKNDKEGFFEIVMGERRYRASRIAGKKTIPAVIREMSDEDAAADALLENFQREDLNPIEKARAVQGLLQFMSYEKAARTLGVSETTVRRLLDLLELPPALQNELVTRPSDNSPAYFGEGHARALLSLNGEPDTQMRLVEKIKSERMSVSNLEQLIKAIQEYPNKKEVFLRASSQVGDQMLRSIRATEERKKPYKPQTAKDHVRNLDRHSSTMAELLDDRVVEFLSGEEMNQLLATMTVLGKQIEGFTGKLRSALEMKDFGFREVYTHCPLCGRIELVGTTKCSVCWTILKRCVDCGHYDRNNQRCGSLDVAVSEDDAESPREASPSYRCTSYRPRFTPKGVPLPIEASATRSTAGRRF